MMSQCLDYGFGDHDVHPLFYAGQGDFVMSIIGSEDDGNVAGLIGLDGGEVGFGIDGVVGGEGVAG